MREEIKSFRSNGYDVCINDIQNHDFNEPNHNFFFIGKNGRQYCLGFFKLNYNFESSIYIEGTVGKSLKHIQSDSIGEMMFLLKESMIDYGFLDITHESINQDSLTFDDLTSDELSYLKDRIVRLSSDLEKIETLKDNYSSGLENIINKSIFGISHKKVEKYVDHMCIDNDLFMFFPYSSIESYKLEEEHVSSEEKYNIWGYFNTGINKMQESTYNRLKNLIAICER